MCRRGHSEKEMVDLVGILGARVQAGKGHSSPHISEFSGRRGGTVKRHRIGWVQALDVAPD